MHAHCLFEYHVNLISRNNKHWVHKVIGLKNNKHHHLMITYERECGLVIPRVELTFGCPRSLFTKVLQVAIATYTYRYSCTPISHKHKAGLKLFCPNHKLYHITRAKIGT